jgi:hypothetical protein
MVRLADRAVPARQGRPRKPLQGKGFRVILVVSIRTTAGAERGPTLRRPPRPALAPAPALQQPQ